MYLAIIVALMFAFPLGSVAYEVVATAVPLSLILISKWFAFWSVGVRLSFAGLRQVIQPRYMAQVILSLSSEESFILVRELGFANLAIGLLGLGSLFVEHWRSAAALVGGAFTGRTLKCIAWRRSSTSSIVMNIAVSLGGPGLPNHSLNGTARRRRLRAVRAAG